MSSPDARSSVKNEQLAPGFRLCIAENYEEMSLLAAGEMAGELRAKPELLLCAATGASPTRAYELLSTKKMDEPELFRSLRIAKLDEWGQLPMEDEGSCESYLQKHLLGPLQIAPERYFGYQSQASPESECSRINAMLAASGAIDLCILGLGLNGHLGFNEPADALQPRAHRAELTPSSLQHSMIQKAKVPITYGLTLGMADLLQSRKIIILVNGAHKADALRQLLSRQISTHFPASFLWLHPQVICFCDRAATVDAAVAVDRRATVQQ